MSSKSSSNSKSGTGPAIIGVLRGMETTFPDALVPHINETYGSEGVRAEFIELDAVRLDVKPPWDVILDRISHDVPFYRSFLKYAALRGTYVVNNPFWWSADDKYIDNLIAERAGVAVPRSAVLPHFERPDRTSDESFRNLKYPLDWDGLFEYIGFPAFLKPIDGGGWRGVTKVETPDEFFMAYHKSGQDCMMLQEGIEYSHYFRCYGVGRTNVHIMLYNPAAEPHRRYFDVPDGPVPDELLEQVHSGVLAICKALGYDFNTVEFAVRDGIPYAIDFMNPAPDADYHAVGFENFDWVV
ncbi:MAG: hypothetical protein HKN17_05605, partial [Rhodothermales bacterium]|nr:hypothetical protein [Rhodothermales bacterium]